MAKKEKSKIFLSPKAERIVRSFCRAHNRDINEFIEEAVTEKIEYEELDKDTLLAAPVDIASGDELYAEDPADEGFKRKH